MHMHMHMPMHMHTQIHMRARAHTHTHGVQLYSVEIYIFTYTCIHTERGRARESASERERERVCVWRGALYYVAAARWSLRPAAAGGMIEYDVRHPDSWRVRKRKRFSVQGSGFRVQGSGFRVQGSGFRVQGSGSRVWGLGVQVAGARALSVREAQHVHAHGDTCSGEQREIMLPHSPHELTYLKPRPFALPWGPQGPPRTEAQTPDTDLVFQNSPVVHRGPCLRVANAGLGRPCAIFPQHARHGLLVLVPHSPSQVLSCPKKNIRMSNSSAVPNKLK
jgi:hypothetical protein